jgi:hypothetical protein
MYDEDNSTIYKYIIQKGERYGKPGKQILAAIGKVWSVVWVQTN